MDKTLNSSKNGLFRLTKVSNGICVDQFRFTLDIDTNIQRTTTFPNLNYNQSHMVSVGQLAK